MPGRGFECMLIWVIWDWPAISARARHHRLTASSAYARESMATSPRISSNTASIRRFTPSMALASWYFWSTLRTAQFGNLPFWFFFQNCTQPRKVWPQPNVKFLARGRQGSANFNLGRILIGFFQNI